jgi:uncharacterized protein
MDRSKQREIASKGGKAAHQKGTAHEWTSEEAREAGRKGGMASHRRKQQNEMMDDESPETNRAPDMEEGPQWRPAESMARGSDEPMSRESEASIADESEAPDNSMPGGHSGRGNFGDDDIR